MSLEEHVHFHENWLRSIESNLERLTAAQATANEAIAVVAQNQSAFVGQLADLTREVRTIAGQLAELAGRHGELADQHRRLEQAFEQYLRARANGNPSN